MSKTRNYKPSQKVAHQKVSEPLLTVKEKLSQDSITGVIEHLYGKKAHSNSELEKLIKETHLPVKTLAEQVFEVTPKTLNSYKISSFLIIPFLAYYFTNLRKTLLRKIFTNQR